MDPLKDISWVSKVTGLSVSTLYKMSALDQIPVVRFGRKIMFRSCDIEEFINDRLNNVAAVVKEQAYSCSNDHQCKKRFSDSRDVNGDGSHANVQRKSERSSKEPG